MARHRYRGPVYNDPADFVSDLKSLRVGESLEVPPHGSIEKLGADSYLLRDRGVPYYMPSYYRNFWGNLSDVVSEAAHYITTKGLSAAQEAQARREQIVKKR